MVKRLTIHISANDHGMTVQNYLRTRAGFSPAQIRSMKFRENGICINQTRVRVTELLKTGDLLELLLENNEKNSSHLISNVQELELLYEDEDVLVVNKPSGVAVHPARGHYSDTLSNQAAAYFRQKGMEVPIHTIGRLDLETSGIVLFAKGKIAAARLSAQRECKTLQKQYLALCSGVFGISGWNTISAPIAPAKDSSHKMHLCADGKSAVTCFCVERQYPHAALVRFRLKTGRTHQIRVHMAGMGHPLLGDSLYGNRTAPSLLNRTALHAAALDFLQPFTQAPISVRAPLPPDMQTACRILETS